MPGFAFLGKFALGQVGPPSIIVPGGTATAVAGVISASTGAVPGVSAKGSAGNLIPSTLSINPHRLLANVVRRTRKLGPLSVGL